MHNKLPLGSLILFVCLLFMVSGRQNVMGSSEIASVEGQSFLYLPFVKKGGTGSAATPIATSTPPSATATATQVPPSPTATTPPTPERPATDWLPYEVAGELHNTASSDIAVDSAGGMHVAYRPIDTGFDEAQPVYYGYCASNCDDQESFTSIALTAGDDYASLINLELDAQGRPRLLWEVYEGFRYAQCNSGCTSPSNWTISAGVIGRLDSLADGSTRMLALDHQGRPRFVFNDSTWGDHSGLYYMACDSACTNAANWREIRISGASYREPSLALTSAGQPRIAFKADVEDGTRIGYIACDVACDNPSSAEWAGVVMEYIDYSYSHVSLSLDSQNRPRLALYSGPIDEGGDLAPETTYYMWCNTACADYQSAQWAHVALPLVGDVYHFSTLALDSQNRPRIAYSGQNGIRYAWCNSSCESPSGTWTEQLVDDENELDETDPVTPPPNCAYPGWSLGYSIELALDGAGNPRMTYDAKHICLVNWDVRTNLAWARFATFEQP